MKRLLPFIILLLGMQISNAQSPIVQSIEPANMHNAVPRDADILIDFEGALDPESVNDTTVKIFGRWSGPASGTITLEDNDKRIRFSPGEAFIAGEWVTVSLTKGIRSANEHYMEKGYTWNFWIATKEGSLEPVLIDQIAAREPGEGLIQVYGAYAGDLNNDGFSDLTVVNETADDLRIFLNDGTGKYEDFSIYPMGNMSPSPNEGADFNNDGEIDLAVSTAHHNEVRVLMGDGSGGFSGQTDYTIAGTGVRGLAVLDCNGDGYDDIFFTNRLSDDAGMLVNDGAGNFLGASFNLSGTGETACAVADANNDGIPDVFVGFYNSQELGILLGDGEGSFSLSDKVSVTGRPWMIAVGDLNGDGHADVASANSFGNKTAVAFGDGMGNLSTPVHYDHSNYQFPLAIDFGDLDGDGDLEMVTSNYESATYTIFENDGTGGFNPVINLNAPANASCAILHDRDNDGDLDITTTDETDDIIQIYDNPGVVNAVDELVVANFQIEVSPNPFDEVTSIQFKLKEAADVELQLFNVSGQMELSLFSGKLPEGQHKLGLGNEHLDSGLYLLRLKVGDQLISEGVKLVKQ